MSDPRMPGDGRPASVLDEQAARLRGRHPGWRVWYIRSAVTRAVHWSAQPARYPLIAGSADELAALIEADPCSDTQPKTGPDLG